MTLQLRPEDLRAVIGLLRTAAHVDAIRALADALDRRLSDPDAPGLDQLLGLAAPGKVAPARHLAIARRDDALRRHARAHHGGLSARAAAAVMAQALRRYETTRHARDLDAGHAPTEGLPAIAHAALTAGLPLPGPDGLRRILSA